MSERGILMHARSVQNVLAGRKTQTRRIVKPQPENACEFRNAGDCEWEALHYVAMGRDQRGHIGFVKCPYGQPGDRLWVRETWQTLQFEEAMSEGFGTGYADDWYECNPEDARKYLASGEAQFRSFGRYGIAYKADAGWEEHKDDRGFNWRPSLHMPRWASRITLEITDIRVERLNQMTNADAVAEGETEHHDTGLVPLVRYAELWDHLNAKRGFSWQSNPWVWVLGFRRV